MNNWYGWVIEQSLDNQSLFDMVPTLRMKSEEEDWTEHIIEVPEDKINDVINFLKQNLKSGWYTHLVKGKQMIVVYKDKDFRIKEGDDFALIREYGLSIGVPQEQLPDSGLFDQAREEGL